MEETVNNMIDPKAVNKNEKWLYVIGIVQIYFFLIIIQFVVSISVSLSLGNGLKGFQQNMDPSSILEVFLVFCLPLICSTLFLLIYVWKVEKSLEGFGIYWPKSISGKYVTFMLLLAFPVMLAYFYLTVGIAVISYGMSYIMVGISEEFLFRGFIQGKLQQIIHPYTALIITSFLFAFAMHSGFLDNLWVRFPLGLILGFMFLKFNSVWPGVIAHSGYDIFVVLINN